MGKATAIRSFGIKRGAAARLLSRALASGVLVLAAAGCTGGTEDASPTADSASPEPVQTQPAARIATPTPTASPAPAADASPTPTATPDPAADATPTPTATPAPAADEAPTPTPTPTPAALTAPEPTEASLAACAADGAVPDAAARPGLVRDCAVLLDALDALVGDGDPPNWSAERPITEWAGVSVGGSPPRVVGLFRHSIFAGHLPSVLGQLSALESLDLHSQELTGDIPAELGLLANLRSMDLQANQLTGEIPSELGRLSQLRVLNLRWNRVTGEIPPELGRLSQLRELHLGRTALTGEIPPELGRLSELEVLDLGTWSGRFPVELGQLTKLRYLNLRVVSMTGCIPPSLAPFSLYWDLAFCRESAAESALPPPDAALVNACSNDGAVAEPDDHPGLVQDCAVLLEAKPILAADESLLNWSADLPMRLWKGITVEGSPLRVTDLWLTSDDLGGRIPAGLGRLSHLRELWLSGNQLTGPIPPELGQLWNLRNLWLGDNRLSGEIPTALADLRFLREMRLGDNEITGHIPVALTSMSTLTHLGLRDNRLSGPIPIELANLTNLDYLQLNGNRLTGPIPPELFSLQELGELDLRDNLLTGPLPPQLATFDGSGWGLRLGGNLLTGCLSFHARDVITDFHDLGLAYCECPALLSSGASPEPGVGGDGIPLMPHDTTAVAGTYRVTFALVLDLPEGGEFSLGWKERNDAGRIIVTITEELSRSTLVIDPFTGEELTRTVVEGPPDCAVRIADLFDSIVASARSQPLDPPEGPDGVRSLYLLQPAEGGRAYRPAGWNHVFDVPDGVRITFDGYRYVCNNPGGCHTILTLRDEDSASTLLLDAATGEELTRYVAEPGSEPGVDALFDRLVGSIRKDAPLSCDLPAAAPDCAVLLDIKATLAGGGDPPNWSTEEPLTAWDGVGVHTLTGRVVHLSWRGDGVSSRIPAALAQLSALEMLDLYGMTGTIPPELGRLANLRVLDLRLNDLTGGIPPDLGQLSSLRVLDLSVTGLRGEIPPELGSLGKLRELDLSVNNLTGGIPPELGRLSNLQVLDLSINELTGEFPTELLDLTNLQHLRLDGLTGEIPRGIGTLSNLQELELSGRIEGEIPPDLGRLSRLRRLSLDRNQLTGEIPPELGMLWNLTSLGLSDNQLTGGIPPELGRLGRLELIRLDGNRLEGCIPPALERYVHPAPDSNPDLRVCTPGE